ncbi:MAG: outer membrane beta-barrel protein, partial [Bacteroidota bacterium]
KLSETSAEQTADPTSIQGFGLEGGQKYLSANVEIDRSPVALASLTESKDPEFSQEQLFLNVLLEGKASLLYYEYGRLEKYFYQVDGGQVQQLVYKQYLAKNSRKLLENNAFRTQLWDDLSCEVFSVTELNDVDYQKTDLLRYFESYNTCKGQGFMKYQKPATKTPLHLSIRPGVRWASFDIRNASLDRYDANFGDQTSFRIGAELEIPLPINKNKWAIIIEPTYHDFELSAAAETENVTAKYNSIMMPAGVRHYFYLNDKNSVFLNAFYVFDFHLDSGIDYERNRDLEVSSKNSFGFGAGYSYNRRLSVEFRYFLQRNLVENYAAWSSDYNSASFIVGYR